MEKGPFVRDSGTVHNLSQEGVSERKKTPSMKGPLPFGNSFPETCVFTHMFHSVVTLLRVFTSRRYLHVSVSVNCNDSNQFGNLLTSLSVQLGRSVILVVHVFATPPLTEP